MRAIFLGCLLWIGLCCGAVAQGSGALAQVDAARSGVAVSRGWVTLTLGLSIPVPYRVYTLDNPRQLVVELSEVAWAGLPIDALQTQATPQVQVGTLAPGWSGMIVTLSDAYIVKTAQMQTATNAAGLVIEMKKSTVAEFERRSGVPEQAAAFQVAQRPTTAGPRAPVVVIDPGHGGPDSGAVREGVRESDLVLRIGGELRDALLREGVTVHMTREADVFVGLPERASVARRTGADAFISLHADALPQGYAEGATVYTLAEEASDSATALLAERMNRGEILTGVDLSGQDDQIATILLDLARRDTEPRSNSLATTLVEQLNASGARLNTRPRRAGDFAVLRSADVPSVLVEVGFLSSKKDRIELQSPEKRARIVQGLARGILGWIATDETERALSRQ